MIHLQSFPAASPPVELTIGTPIESGSTGSTASTFEASPLWAPLTRLQRSRTCESRLVPTQTLRSQAERSLKTDLRVRTPPYIKGTAPTWSMSVWVVVVANIAPFVARPGAPSFVVSDRSIRSDALCSGSRCHAVWRPGWVQHLRFRWR